MLSQDQLHVGPPWKKIPSALHYLLGAGSLPLEVKREPYFWVSKGHNLGKHVLTDVRG